MVNTRLSIEYQDVGIQFFRGIGIHHVHQGVFSFRGNESGRFNIGRDGLAKGRSNARNGGSALDDRVRPPVIFKLYGICLACALNLALVDLETKRSGAQHA